MISIYVLTDPIDGKIRYIGQSKHPRSRYKQHIAESRARQNTKKKKWIKTLIDLNLQPGLSIIFQTEDKKAARIAESRACHANLTTIYNLHDPQKGAGDFNKNKKC